MRHSETPTLVRKIIYHVIKGNAEGRYGKRCLPRVAPRTLDLHYFGGQLVLEGSCEVMRCPRNFLLARQKCIRMTFILPFPSHFLNNLSSVHTYIFLQKSVHHVNLHVMLFFEQNWLDGYWVINFFSSPTVYFSVGFHWFILPFPSYFLDNLSTVQCPHIPLFFTQIGSLW